MLKLDYLEHLERESARFVTAVLAAPPEAPVPTCPAWTAADLLWHLAEVQWFWGEIVRSGARSPDEYEEPVRPADHAALEAFYRVASGGLLAALAAADPQTPAWTWSSDHTVGFIRRRQAHEALIHRVDAEVTAGARTPLDPLLSTDGVDEVLRVMYGGYPPWATFTPDGGGTVRITATDTGRSWVVTAGRFRGTRPSNGAAYDEPTLDVVSDGGRSSASAAASRSAFAAASASASAAAASASASAAAASAASASASLLGTAADLDCLLWNRPPIGKVERLGDPVSLDTFTAIIEEGVQ